MLPVPRHVGIIMDGNGRWAAQRGLARLKGHRAGKDIIESIVEGAQEIGVQVVSLYSFSKENWARPEDEVQGLMDLLYHGLTNDVHKLQEKGVRLRVIGDLSALSASIQEAITVAQVATADNSAITVVLAINYGARQEIVHAAKSFALSGDASWEDLTPEIFERHLYTHDLPPLDLIIRTSGEHRLSNFFLWQAAYAEFLFSDILWPDLTREIFQDMIQNYRQRERRYGKTSQQI